LIEKKRKLVETIIHKQPTLKDTQIGVAVIIKNVVVNAFAVVEKIVNTN
jgi:hypothetical protein